MFAKWENFLKTACCITSDDRILLTVSGGVDSMLMLELFARSYGEQVAEKLGVAHCNFQLRGGEADADEQLVRESAAARHLPFYCTRFDTVTYAESKGISIEMAARELRYAWFEVMAGTHGYTRIATAHHRDDAEETLFLNLMRGSGIKGLHGILPLSGKLIRPMRCFSRKEIETLAETAGIVFHTDRSNNEDTYRRNYIRHHILPAFRELHPSFDHNLEKSMHILQAQEEVYFHHIQETSRKLLHADGKGFRLLREEITALPYPQTYLFEILHPFGFNGQQTDGMLRTTEETKGKKFTSSTHCLWIHGKEWLLQPLTDEAPANYSIAYTNGRWQTDCPFLQLQIIQGETKISKQPHCACLDFGKLEFPLLVRYWKPGDRFVPFGMKGMKKLSDFFIDRKIPKERKDRIPLLCNGNGDILWIVGLRSDNRYRVTEKTTETLILTYQET